MRKFALIAALVLSTGVQAADGSGKALAHECKIAASRNMSLATKESEAEMVDCIGRLNKKAEQVLEAERARLSQLTKEELVERIIERKMWILISGTTEELVMYFETGTE